MLGIFYFFKVEEIAVCLGIDGNNLKAFFIDKNGLNNRLFRKAAKRFSVLMSVTE